MKPFVSPTGGPLLALAAFRGRHYFTDQDYTREELLTLLQPEDEKNEPRRILGPYQVNEALWVHTKPGGEAHALPARHPRRGDDRCDPRCPLLDHREWDKVDDLLADDFQYTGDGNPPIDKQQYIAFMRGVLCAGMSDMDMNSLRVIVEGDLSAVRARAAKKISEGRSKSSSSTMIGAAHAMRRIFLAAEVA